MCVLVDFASLRFHVGEMDETIALTVNPLNVEFVNLDSIIYAGEKEAFQIKVTDIDGNPVEGAEIQLGSTYGFVGEEVLTTLVDGTASTTITAPDSNGSGEVTVQVGRTALIKHAFNVNYPSFESRDLEVNSAMMIGDQAAVGVINHVRYDSTAINVPYKIEETIQALGVEGESVTVNIGDFRDPNLAPLAAYYMNSAYGGFVADETGRYPLTAKHVNRVTGTAMGGGRSLRFEGENPTDEGSQPSILYTNSVDLLKKTTDIGFSVELLPRETSGTIVDLGDGAQKLTLNSSGQLVYTVRTSGGVNQLTSAIVSNDQWHKVAARYQSGQIQLWVDGELQSAVATGDIDYQASEKELVIGEGFTGRLNSLKWFDWASQPVMSFADGSTQKTVVIGVDGKAGLTLKSTGNMGSNGSLLKVQRVAIHTNKVRQFASLMSAAGFADVAGQYVDTLATDTPPINVAGLTPGYSMIGTQLVATNQNLPLSFMIPSAHADEESSFFWDAINWVLPLEDFGIVFEQLGYLMTDPEKFDGAEFAIALVNVITIFPPAKPLKLFTTPLRAMFRKLNHINPKFAKYFGGVIDGVIKKAKKGEFDTLWNMLPFMVLAAEMYNDPETRKGIEFMFETIDSADDIFSWADYLNLPADGWEGDGEPPEVKVFTDEQENAVSQLPLSWMMGEAVAGPGANAARVASHVLGKALSQVAKQVTKGEAKNLPDALKVIRKELDHLEFKDFRKFVYSKEAMKSSVWIMTQAGARSLRNFVTGKSNARYSSATIVATMGYLGWESSCGVLIDAESEAEELPPLEEGEIPVTSDTLGCDTGSGKKGLNAKVRSEIGKKIAKLFADAASKDLDEEPISDNSLPLISGGGHGALFHLVQTAYYQLQYRFAGGAPIKELEGTRYIALFEDSSDRPEQDSPLICGSGPGKCRFGKYRRYVDIVLGGAGTEETEKWIELKSWAAQTINGDKRYKFQEEKRRGELANWIYSGANKGKIATHKQFSLDRAASKVGRAWLAKKDTGSPSYDKYQPVENSFEWRFQAFDITTRRGNTRVVSAKLGDSGIKGSFRWLVHKRPEGKNDEVSNYSFGSDSSHENNAVLVTPKQIIEDLIERGFSAAVSATDIVDIEID